MAITAPRAEGKSFDPAPKGTHVARLYKIVLLGTNEREFQGEKGWANEVLLTFELCNVRKTFKEGEPEKPMSLSRTFTLSMGKKSNLRPFVEGFIGTALSDDESYAFDIESLLGEPCLLSVVHKERNDNVYANIHSAMQIPAGMPVPELFNEKKVVDVRTSPVEDIEALPEFMKEKIYSSREWQQRNNAFAASGPIVNLEDVNPDDVPF